MGLRQREEVKANGEKEVFIQRRYLLMFYIADMNNMNVDHWWTNGDGGKLKYL